MYSSMKDVRNALTPGGDANDTTSAAAIDDVTLIDAIREADSVIDVYLGSRYVISMDTSDPDSPVAVEPVRSWSRNLAAWNATLVWKRGKDIPPDSPIRLRYNALMALLTSIRDGRADLSLPPIAGGGGYDVLVVNLYEGSLFSAADFDLSRNGSTTKVQQPYIWPGV